MYSEFFRGQSVGKKDQTKFPSLVNCDVHSEPGTITCSKALTKISATTITQFCQLSAKLPNGNTFWANSTDGKIWKEANGTVSLVHTNSNGANFGLEYSRGYLYYASATKLGRIAEANASSEATWSSQNDSWGTFTNTNTHIFKMATVRGKLLIPNKNKLAMVSFLGAFTAGALDLNDDQSITCVYPDYNTAVIGTDKGAIFLWDTLNSSWLWEDFSDEAGVNMIFKLDKAIYLQIGTVGNLYRWSGQYAYLWGRLRNNGAVTTSLNPYGNANLNGLQLISTNQGIYSLGRADSSFPIAQVIEYSPSESGAEGGAIEVYGNSLILGWKKTTTYGLDKTGTTYSTAVITTPEASVTPKMRRKSLRIAYDSLLGNSNITATVSVDGGAFTAVTLVKDDTDKKNFHSKDEFSPKKTIQAKISLVPDGTNLPVVDNISLI